jgi:flagellar hook-associated protein 1
MINSLYTPVSGLNTSKTQIEVSMNNIANQESDGYKKRVANSEENSLYSSEVGMGSSVTSITRAVDKEVENRLLGAIGKYEYHNTQKELIEIIDNYNLEPGMKDVLKDITDSFVQLRNNPNDPEFKHNLQSSIELFAYNTNNLMEKIDDANLGAVNGAKESISKINEITEKIAITNKSIGLNAKPPLDLLDKRDALEKELSGFVKFESKDTNGVYSLTIDGHDLPLITSQNNHELFAVEETISNGYLNSYNVDSAHLDSNRKLEDQYSKQYEKDGGGYTDDKNKAALDGFNNPIDNSDFNKSYKPFKYIDTNGDTRYSDVAKVDDLGVNQIVEKNYTDGISPDDYLGYYYDIETIDLRILDKRTTDTSSNLINDNKISNENLADKFIDTGKGALTAQLNYASDDFEKNDILKTKRMMVNMLADFKDSIKQFENDQTPAETFDLYNIDFTMSSQNGTKKGEYISAVGQDEINKLDIKVIDAVVNSFNNKTNAIEDGASNMNIHEQENYIRTTIHSNYKQKEHLETIEKASMDLYQNQSDKLSKVDPTDEMIEMMQYQAAYQASAKMVQAIDEMIQTLLGLKR